MSGVGGSGAAARVGSLAWKRAAARLSNAGDKAAAARPRKASANGAGGRPSSADGKGAGGRARDAQLGVRNPQLKATGARRGTAAHFSLHWEQVAADFERWQAAQAARGGVVPAAAGSQEV